MDRPSALDVIARTVHEAMRAYREALGEAPLPRWEDAGRMQDASREAVESALSCLTARAQHEAWVAAKRRDGWSYGPTKDAHNKTHPSLVDFDRLPATEQRKDEVVLAVVHALAPVLGVRARDRSGE
jgi:hypothetical protein